MSRTVIVFRRFRCAECEQERPLLCEFTESRQQYKVPFGDPKPVPACPDCSTDERLAVMDDVSIRSARNQQIDPREAAAVAIHPKTGEVVYCFDTPTRDMPAQYRNEGFQKVQFHTARALEQFCRERGLVNDAEYGNKHDGYHEEMQRVQAERRTQLTPYEKARREVMREMGLLKD
jgi:hypothetical protein